MEAIFGPTLSNYYAWNENFFSLFLLATLSSSSKQIVLPQRNGWKEWAPLSFILSMEQVWQANQFAPWLSCTILPPSSTQMDVAYVPVACECDTLKQDLLLKAWVTHRLMVMAMMKMRFLRLPSPQVPVVDRQPLFRPHHRHDAHHIQMGITLI